MFIAFDERILYYLLASVYEFVNMLNIPRFPLSKEDVDDNTLQLRHYDFLYLYLLSYHYYFRKQSNCYSPMSLAAPVDWE